MSTKYIASNWRLPNQAGVDSYLNDNYGLTFDGSSEVVDTNLDSSSYNSFSISAWVKGNNLGTYQTVAAQARYGNWSNSSWILYIEAPGGTPYMTFYIASGGSITLAGKNTVLSSDQWYHIVGTWDGSTSKLYINGVKETTEGAVSSMNTSVVNTLIGEVKDSAGTGSRGFWDGKISEVAIFDYALSESQISTLYGSSSLGAGNPMALKPAPVAFYPLGDNSSGNPLTQPNEAVEDASVFDFDTSDVQLNNVINLGTTWTISFWIKTTQALNSNGTILAAGSGNDFTLLLLRNNRLTFYRGAGADFNYFLTGTAFNDGQWHNIVLTRNGTSEILPYYDGQLSATETRGTGNLDSKFEFIGDDGGTWGTAVPFDGELSNIVFWKSDQTTEISNIYNSGVPATTYTNTPTAWYKLDQSANWEADSSGAWQIPDAVSAYPQSFKVSTSNSIDFSNGLLSDLSAFSISFWYNRKAINGATSPLLRQNGVIEISQFRQSASYSGIEILLTTVNGQSNILTVSQGNVPTGEWLHIAIVYDGSNMTLFRNGSEAAGSYNPVAATGNTVNNTNVFEIPTQTGLQYGISNLQVFDTALPATGTDSIETLYNNGVPLTTAILSDNLKIWYKLNDNEKFDGTNWSVENQKYPANWESAISTNIGATTETDYVNLSSSFTTGGASDNSISFWLKTTQGSGDNTILGSSSSRYITVHFNKIRSVSTSGEGFRMSSNAVVNDGVWHHVVYTYNQTSGSWKVYVDGDFDNSVTALTGQDVFPINRFGGRPGFTNFYYDGFISNVAYYDVELSAPQISALYNNGTPETSISSSPISWWKLDNTTTGIQDSVGSNDGTNNGATKVNTFVSTEAGTSSGMTEQNLVNNNVSALNGESSGMTSANLVLSDLTRAVPYDSYSFNFDSASSDYINLGNSTDLRITPNLTVSAWFKTSTSQVGKFINRDGFVSGTRDYALYQNASNIQFWVSHNGTGVGMTVLTSTGFTANDNNWHHAVGVCNGTNIELYIDGVLNVSGTNSTAGINTSSYINEIGSRTTGTANFYDGLLSNISLFNEALTSTEVMKLYSNGMPQDLTTFTPSPIAWWTLGSNSFFNGSDFICKDLIGSNDGTSVNAGVDALQGNTPRSEANGTGTNMDIPTNLEGTTKYSSNNSWSINMSESARVENTP